MMLNFLGIVFLILIGLAAVVGIWLYGKIRSGIAQQERVSAIEESMHLPEFILEPNDHPEYVQPETIETLVREATNLGAISCGSYDVPAAAVRLCAFCLESPSVYIAIYDSDQLEPWVDVVLRLDQERSFAASTVPEIGRGAPRPPENEVVYFAPGTRMGVLVNATAEHAGSGDAVIASPEAFKNYFEEASEKSRQYIKTQAVSQDWLDTIAVDAGVELAGDEAAHINMLREGQQVAQTEIDCFESLAESGAFTAAQWNEMRDDLVAVWDDMPGEYVAGVIYGNTDIPDELDDEVDALENGHGRARERIAELNARLPEEDRLILVGRVSSPVEADIYRGKTLGF